MTENTKYTVSEKYDSNTGRDTIIREDGAGNKIESGMVTAKDGRMQQQATITSPKGSACEGLSPEQAARVAQFLNNHDSTDKNYRAERDAARRADGYTSGSPVTVEVAAPGPIVNACKAEKTR